MRAENLAQAVKPNRQTGPLFKRSLLRWILSAIKRPPTLAGYPGILLSLEQCVGRQHEVERSPKGFRFGIQADEPEITQPQFFRFSLCDGNRRRRAIDADQIRTRQATGIKGCQDAEATPEIEDILCPVEVGERSQPDCFIKFIPLAIENGIDPRLRGTIIKRNFITTVADTLSFSSQRQLL
jgi:hypothetical protein